MSGEEFTKQDSCGCCEGVNIKAPALISNRPGLGIVAYRIGTHSEVLASLQARLSSQDYPALAKLRTRDRDDFSIALLDAYACMADVLSFYQERLANESYLRTAGERLSLGELARLIGYRLKPGVAAETYLAFTLQEPPPQAESTEPKQGSGVPDKVTLDIGIKVQSMPGPDEKPQTFETVESIEARPEWNALRAAQSQTQLPLIGRTDLYLQGTALGLRAGDSLLFVGDEYLSGGNTSLWQFRLIASVTIDAANQRTRIRWYGALNPQVHVFRKKAAVFGHNAPMWETMPLDFRNNYPKPTGWTSGWPGYMISPDVNAVDLDSVYADVVPDSSEKRSFAVLVDGMWAAPFKVNVVSEVSRSAFAMAAKVTRISLAGTDYATYQTSVRETAVYIASEKLSIALAPITSAVAGDQILLDSKVEAPPSGRTLIISGRLSSTGAEAVETATLKQMSVQNGVSRFELVKALQNSYQRETVAIYANVALATHGETVHQILGSGTARQSHQRYTLKHTPLTFVGAENETGAEAALEVRVNDIRWHEAPTLYNAGAEDRSYVLRSEEDGAGTIQFGDGRHGARLPTGQDNVRAIYRKGIGAAGNLQAGQLSQLLTRPLGLNAVSNPLPSEGGVDADSAAQARRNMPLGVRTLGRVVSLQDYEDYARAYTGIAKAQAAVLNTRAGRTVFITIAGEDGVQPPDATLDKLLNALKQNGDPLVHCETKAYNEATFHLGLRIKRDPDHDIKKVLADVEAALRAAFSFDARDFGQTVARSEVIAVAHEVEGVLGVDLDRFYRGTYNPNNPVEQRLKPAAATTDAQDNGIAAELLLLDAGPFDNLEEMP
ncbi:MAG: putative baseplate assembly protein [Gallionella sp.]|nr:putative baseplate assembly protein [Gallionella sp.]